MTLAPSTQTSILLGALAELGSTDRPTSIDDTTSGPAKRAKVLWNDIVRELLAAHPWNFAIQRKALNATGTAPEHGYARAFQLPGDCVRWLPGAASDPDFALAEQEGNLLLSDATEPLNIRYVALNDDIARWPPGFVTAVKLSLAASLAEGVTQSEGIKDRLLQRAADALREGKRQDGLATGRRRRGGVVAQSNWLGARNRPYGWRGR